MSVPSRLGTAFWNTLAVETLDRSRAFYAALGFEVRPMPGGAGLVVVPAPGGMVCLFPRAIFAPMIPGEPCDPTKAQELVQSVQTAERAGVDELVARAVAAGGRAIGAPREQPFGYSGGFSDPDGHVWAVLWLPPPPGAPA